MQTIHSASAVAAFLSAKLGFPVSVEDDLAWPTTTGRKGSAAARGAQLGKIGAALPCGRVVADAVVRFDADKPIAGLESPVLIESANPDYGFYGTAVSNFGLSSSQAGVLFHRTAEVLVSLGVVADAAAAVEVLDYRLGRHFADALTHKLSHGAAVGALLAEATFLLSSPGWQKAFRKALAA